MANLSDLVGFALTVTMRYKKETRVAHFGPMLLLSCLHASVGLEYRQLKTLLILTSTVHNLKSLRKYKVPVGRKWHFVILIPRCGFVFDSFVLSALILVLLPQKDLPPSSSVSCGWLSFLVQCETSDEVL